MSKKLNPDLTKALVIWGEHRRGEVRGLETLGYPSLTQDAKLYNSPGKSSILHQSPNYFPDKTALWVEYKLRNVESKYVNAIWCRFVLVLEDERAASAMGLEKTQYRTLFDQSLRKVADALNMRCWIRT